VPLRESQKATASNVPMRVGRRALLSRLTRPFAVGLISLGMRVCDQSLGVAGPVCSGQIERVDGAERTLTPRAWIGSDYRPITLCCPCGSREGDARATGGQDRCAPTGVLARSSYASRRCSRRSCWVNCPRTRKPDPPVAVRDLLHNSDGREELHQDRSECVRRYLMGSGLRGSGAAR
jgi:hypothetical protein